MTRAYRELVSKHNEFFAEVSWGGIRLRRKGLSAWGVRTFSGGQSLGFRGPSTAGRVVKEFSAFSRLHMRERFAALPWEECGPRLAMVTYTYPREFSTDGLLVRRHREAMKMRITRKWGPPKGAWVLEFQKRGAPHLHTYVGLPDVPEDVFLAWAKRAWYEIVGSEDWRHLYQGVDVRRAFYGRAEENARRVADYFWRESGKLEQKQVPEEYVNVGRFWGYWGLRPQVERTSISVHEWVEMRRLMLALLRHQPGQHAAKGPRGFDGMLLIAEDGYWLFRMIAEYARDVVSWKEAQHVCTSKTDGVSSWCPVCGKLFWRSA